MTAHSALADSELHELKGAASAAEHSMPTSDGAGSSNWQKLQAESVDTSSIFNVNKVYLTTKFKDIASADIIYVYLPFAGTLTEVATVLENAITTGDNTITVKNNAGSSMGTITVTQSGSAAGDIDTLAPASNNTFTPGQKVILETNGASDTAAELFVTLTFTVTG